MAQHATGRGSAISLAPRNVEQISKTAQQYEYSALVPLRYWLRTAGTLLTEACVLPWHGFVVLTILRQAEIYEREGDNETTYFLLFRHAHLILTNLVVHPDAKEPLLRARLAEAQKEVNKNLKKLDLLKPKVNKRYDEYLEHKRQTEQRRAELSQNRRGSPEELQQIRGDEAYARTLDAAQNQDLAVQLAHDEMSRRQTARQRARDDDNDLSRQMQAVAARVEMPQQKHDQQRAQSIRKEASYNYPSIPVKHSTLPVRPVALPPPVANRDNADNATAPQFPPKPSMDSTVAPTRPPKAPNEPARASVNKETSYTFAPAAFLENGEPLRTLFVPPTLRTTFLRVAHKNTIANLETCGFLAGTLISNALFVSKLVIPAQTSTSDTCEMTNESDLFDYVDNEPDLMILGWIHTHPTQTCFMSSRDLHTHAGYQMMLAESVAIVCAPSKGNTSHGGDWGAYRLTDPPGKKTILACEKPGIFHPHAVDNVYTDALRPGHVVEAHGLEFELVDLRAG